MNKPYLVKQLPLWETYSQAQTGLPVECAGCSYDGPGTKYCSKLQHDEMQRQWEMYCIGEKPKATEEFHLDCPKELQERRKATKERQQW